MFKTISQEERTSAGSNLSGRNSKGWVASAIKSEYNYDAFRPIDGPNKFRLLPPLEADDLATVGGIGVWKYYAGGNTYISPTTLNSGARDPMLEKYRKYKLIDPKRANAFKPTRAVMAYVLDYNRDEDPTVVKLFMCSASLMKRILERAEDRETGKIIPIDHPEEGRVVMFDKSGKGLTTTYTREEIGRNPDPLQDPEAIADQMKPFKDIIKIYSYEELAQLAEDTESIADNSGRDIPDEEDDGAWPSPKQNASKDEDVDIRKREGVDEDILNKVRAQMNKGKDTAE